MTNKRKGQYYRGGFPATVTGGGRGNQQGRGRGGGSTGRGNNTSGNSANSNSTPTEILQRQQPNPPVETVEEESTAGPLPAGNQIQPPTPNPRSLGLRDPEGIMEIETNLMRGVETPLTDASNALTKDDLLGLLSSFESKVLDSTLEQQARSQQAFADRLCWIRTLKRPYCSLWAYCWSVCWLE